MTQESRRTANRKIRLSSRGKDTPTSAMKTMMGSSYFENGIPAEYLQDIIQINKDAATTLLKRKKFVVAITPEFFDWLL